jgi:capsular polysaccharide biosynthesis protein
VSLKDYLNVIRKRWWLALITVLVAAGVAFGYSSTQPKLYESTVVLRGDVGKPDAGLYNSLQQLLKTYNALFTSTDFANQINQQAGLDRQPQDILAEIHVQAQPDNYEFVINVDDRSPENARKIADEAANILITKNLADNEGLNPDQEVFIVKNSPASLPDKPYSPRTLLLSGAGTGLGLVLGVIFMFVAEFLDDTIKDETDVSRYANLKALGVIPTWRTKNIDNTSRTIAVQPTLNSANSSTADNSRQAKPN